MRKVGLSIASIALMALTTSHANAATFSWTFEDTQGGKYVYGSGTIAVTDTGSTAADSADGGTKFEEYTVTGITGSFYNETSGPGSAPGTTLFVIAGLNTNLTSFGTVDNELFYNTGAGAVDLSGIGFTLSTEGGYSLTGQLGNIQCLNLSNCYINFEGYSDPSNQTTGHFTDGLVGGSDDEYIVTLTATPLPAALPLFGTGLGVISALCWRRKRKNNATLAAA